MPFKTQPFLILGAASLTTAVLAMAGDSVPFSLRAAAALFMLAILAYCLVAEFRVWRKVRDKLTGLQGMLVQSLNEILRESAQEMGLHENLDVLESDTPEQAVRRGFWAQAEFSQSLFNKQINLFRAKNKTIKDLNDKILFSKQQLEAVFDAQEDSLCMVDRDLVIFRLNRSYARHCGAEIRDLLGKKSHEVFPGIRWVNADAIARKTFDTGCTTTGVQIEAPAGDDRLYFLYSAFPIHEGDRVVYVLEHFRNITTEKKITEQLIRSANLASIGTMIAGIAHEMNNPLSGIAGTAANMLSMPENYGLNEKGRSRMQDVLDSANRAEHILRNLLDLSRKKESQFVIMNILPLVEKSLQSIHIKGYTQVRKTLTVEPGLRPVTNCDPGRATQVFINLLSNATLSVLDRARWESGAGRPFQPEIRVLLRNRNGHLAVSVVDNGVGIPPDKMTQIFDPFYTTRPPGQGTGLGLSICQKIMLEHNGRLLVESGDPGNTAFTVEFPVTGV